VNLIFTQGRKRRCAVRPVTAGVNRGPEIPHERDGIAPMSARISTAVMHCARTYSRRDCRFCNCTCLTRVGGHTTCTCFEDADPSAPGRSVPERAMSDMTDTVGDLPVRFAALEAAQHHVSPSSRCQDTAQPLPQPAVAPVTLVRYRPGNNRGQATRAVHLAPIPNRHVGARSAHCAALT
jgi:hypothetical protein